MNNNQLFVAILLALAVSTAIVVTRTQDEKQATIVNRSASWDNAIRDRPWTRQPEAGAGGTVAPRANSGGKGTEMGRTLYGTPTSGDPNSKASVSYSCGSGGSWCTVLFQARFTAEQGERLKVTLRGGSGQTREAFIPNVVGTESGITTGPRAFAMSVRGCDTCQFEFTIEAGNNNKIDSWADVALLGSKCGDKDETNRPESTHDGTLYDRFGNVMTPDEAPRP